MSVGREDLCCMAVYGTASAASCATIFAAGESLAGGGGVLAGVLPGLGPSMIGGPARSADPLQPAAVRNCPHCDQPVTIVALLATPEAARPTIHQPGSDIIALRRI